MYAIKVTREFYGPSYSRSLARDASTGRAATFETTDAAQEHIDDYLDAGVYYTDHNETGRPEYIVLPVDTLPKYLRWQL